MKCKSRAIEIYVNICKNYNCFKSRAIELQFSRWEEFMPHWPDEVRRTHKGSFVMFEHTPLQLYFNTHNCNCNGLCTDILAYLQYLMHIRPTTCWNSNWFLGSNSFCSTGPQNMKKWKWTELKYSFYNEQFLNVPFLQDKSISVLLGVHNHHIHQTL